MVTASSQSVWRGNLDISALSNLHNDESILSKQCYRNGVLEDLYFLNSHNNTSPFLADATPTALAILDLTQIPTWMFTDKIWELQTTSRETNTFFQDLLQTSPKLYGNSYMNALLVQNGDANIIITATCDPIILTARALHSPSLLTAILTTKYESLSPPISNDDPFHIPQEYTGQFISVVSPQRVLAREASCSQFDAKLESPGRFNPKSRQERRLQNLLPDVARRRKAEMQNPFDTQPTAEYSRHSSVARDIRQTSVSQEVRGMSVLSDTTRLSTMEIQTKEAVKQTVVAALRLHSIGNGDADYKGLISHTVHAAMFALRGKVRAGKMIGIGEMGSVVEELLDIFLNK